MIMWMANQMHYTLPIRNSTGISTEERISPKEAKVKYAIQKWPGITA